MKHSESTKVNPTSGRLISEKQILMFDIGYRGERKFGGGGGGGGGRDNFKKHGREDRSPIKPIDPNGNYA